MERVYVDESNAATCLSDCVYFVSSFQQGKLVNRLEKDSYNAHIISIGGEF